MDYHEAPAERSQPTEDSALPLIDVGQRYTTISEHARGGMAKVYLVRDGVIGRDVALKRLIPPGEPNRDPSAPGEESTLTSTARFIQEARIAGQLEHPSTIPVYELGRDADGAPFYTMKFVRGQTLQAAIGQARSLEERLALLPHFIAICHAVAYAHSRNVVHRDLKPDNIMVGEFGETVVLDWGIAKVLDAEAEQIAEPADARPIAPRTGPEETSSEDILGTPHFMAPEQADPGSGTVDARTDIYALGAILYQILTGGTPYVAYRLPDLLAQIVAGEFRPVRSIERNAPPELAAICERALRRLPADRYQSATELAEDVTRYMTGVPVLAYQYRIAEVLARFLKRNVALVRTIGVAAALLLVFSIWSYVQVAEQRTEALLARDEAETQRRAALDSQQQAERNFEAARRVVDDFFTEVAENDLLEIPGADPVRRSLLERALSYYESFIRDHANDTSLHIDLADAYANVGRINDELGDQAAALPAFLSAIDLLEELAKSTPEEPEIEFRLAQVQRDVAWAYYLTGDAGSAFEAGQRSVTIRQDLVSRFPENPRYLALLAEGLEEIADVVEISGNDSLAVQSIEQALGLYETLASSDPSVEHRGRVAHTYRRLADFYARVNRIDDALRSAEQSVMIHRQLVTETSESRERVFDFATALSTLGSIQANLGAADAAATLRESIDLLADLRESFPGVEKYTYEQSMAYRYLADVPKSTGDLESAAQYLGHSIGLLRSLLASNPENQAFRLQFAIQLTQRMDVLRRDGRYLEAEIDGLDAVEFARDFADRNPEATDGSERLKEARMNLALVYLDAGKTGSYLAVQEEMLPADTDRSGATDLPGAFRTTAAWMLDTPVSRYRNPERALELASAAIELEGVTVSGLELLARAQYDSGNAGEAILTLERALEIASESERGRIGDLVDRFRNEQGGTGPGN